jgi:hypothetical protein
MYDHAVAAASLMMVAVLIFPIGLIVIGLSFSEDVCDPRA